MPKTKVRTDQENTFPFAIMNDFDDDLMDYVDALREVVDKWWKTKAKGITKRRLTQDAPDPFQRAFTDLDQNMTQVYANKNVQADVNKMARLTVSKAHNDLQAEVSNYVGYDPMLRNQKSKQLAQQTVDEAASYIKSIPQEYHRDVERTVLEGVRKGQSIDEVASALDDVYGAASGRTRTIAMDQTGNLYGAVTKAQHQALGLKKFEWVAVLDGRTRPRHQTFAGQKFTWEDGAGGEYPGSAINCRCSAATVKKEVRDVIG